MEKEAFTEEQMVCGPLRTQNICVEMGIVAQRFVTACQDREFLYAHSHVCKSHEKQTYSAVCHLYSQTLM